ncbi:unnamed protein product [Protopolystoma xenopodis]|uniref:Uncharacterized protein n=1 Tax=Protopolystoma xenopodis TaxID=117903 RepID=A0A448WNE7_9PLAT|nr:unnamed protein product [Protopolystoma xenopodis]
MQKTGHKKHTATVYLKSNQFQQVTPKNLCLAEADVQITLLALSYDYVATATNASKLLAFVTYLYNNQLPHPSSLPDCPLPSSRDQIGVIYLSAICHPHLSSLHIHTFPLHSKTTTCSQILATKQTIRMIFLPY